ncbi:DinB family protein [Azospirillum griseum]|uniref:Damage-inducible protein DinB n=1 Tax=Azospirillum griseum TaxID=2496639 RepID=A0A431VDI4_9PROT|nr:DinB family protein [Azospirillum griseum]RTR17214.1 damage-inducible protein DinB [Azospirillum griseum]
MNPKAHFERLALYNRWANRRLYDTASALTDNQFREDRGAFFGSVCGTLNHILVADQIWMGRIEQAGPRHSALDLILHEGLADLRAAREAEDERILRVVAAQPDDRFDSLFAYTNVAGVPQELPFGPVLTHIFNHQTHHRGQASTLLSQFGLKTPVMDFVYFLTQG